MGKSCIRFTKLEDIPLLSHYPDGAGLMRSVKAGEMQIGDVWAHIPIDYTDAYAKECALTN